jgi:predicted methyltransferase
MTQLKSLKSLLLAATLGLTAFTSANLYAHDTHSHAANKALEKAVAGEHRSAKNKARDKYRNPVETLTFFGFSPEMTVVEITPGGGWYTEILAPALKGKGKLYGAHYPDTGEDNYYSKSRQRLEKKLASNVVFSEVVLTDFVPRKQSELAPQGSADLVLTFRNLHNWRAEGVEQVFKDAFNALKPGGVLGVVEHRLPAGVAPEKAKGYVSESETIKQAKAAGFRFAAASEINANPKDMAQHPKGVWTLPPVLRLGDEDKAKYLAIGESDRMTLKFVKPANTKFSDFKKQNK